MQRHAFAAAGSLLKNALLAGGVAAGVCAVVIVVPAFLDSGFRRAEDGTSNALSAEEFAFPAGAERPVMPLREPPGFLRELALVGGDAGSVYLIAAAEEGAENRVALLLRAGVDVNSADADGRTALFTAAAKRNLALVRTLLAAGADANLADHEGRTPLIAATAASAVPVMTEVLDHDGAINAADTSGRSALFYSIAAQNPAAVALLVSRGADCAHAAADGKTALDFAFEIGEREIVKTVLAAQKPALRWNAATRSALSAAMRERDRELTQLLLSKHPAPPTPEGASEPLLAYLIAQGDLDEMKFLLDCGVDANTALAVPAEKKFAQLFSGEMLPHYLATEPGMTPLMLAAGLGRADIAQTLIEHGAKRSTETAKYKLAAVTFAAWAESAPTLLVLYGKSPRIEEQGTRVEISLGSQRALFFKNNVLALSTQISTGKPGRETPTGQFVITDKHPTHKSTIYKVDMPWFMRLNCREFGMHQGVVPNYPASHGCIRMPGDKARELFQQVEPGTLVVIAK